LARAGIIASAELIPLLGAYRSEQTEAVWDIIAMTIGELKKFVENDDISEKQLRTLSASVARAQYERLGWKTKAGEPESDTKMRSTILGLMLYGEYPEAIKTAIDLYHATPIEQLDPELRPLIISTTVRHGGDDAIIDQLVAKHKATSSAELQIDIASGITSTKTPERISAILDMIKDETIVRPQDAARWFVWTIRGREGRPLAWQWLQDNWPWVLRTFKGDKSYDDFPRYSANSLVTRQQLDEYRAFFEPMKDIAALSRVITMGISEIEGRVELIERDRPAVREALAKL
jgi:aminopeptidase N